MFPGVGAQPNRWATDFLVNGISSEKLCRFAFGLRFVCEMCARVCQRSLSGIGRMGGDLSDRVPPGGPSTLPAHCLHTGKPTNRETRVDTVRAG